MHASSWARAMNPCPQDCFQSYIVQVQAIYTLSSASSWDNQSSFPSWITLSRMRFRPISCRNNLDSRSFVALGAPSHSLSPHRHTLSCCWLALLRTSRKHRVSLCYFLANLLGSWNSIFLSFDQHMRIYLLHWIQSLSQVNMVVMVLQLIILTSSTFF